MKLKYLLLVSFVILIIGLTAVSATDSDDTATTDNSGSDVAIDSSSSTTQATDTSTHTDSSVDKTSDASTTSSQKTDVTSQQTTQKVTEKTQTTSDTNAKTSSDSTSQSTQSTSQSTQTNSNTTQTSTNTVNENVVDNSKSISTEDDTSEPENTVWTAVDSVSLMDSLVTANSGDIIDCNGNFSSMTINLDKNITLTSSSGSNFTNTTINIDSSASGSTLSNLFIDNSGSGQAFVNITSGANDITITNNTFKTIDTEVAAVGIELNEASNTKIINNNIDINALAVNMLYFTHNFDYEQIPCTYAIGVFNSTNILVSNNNINISNSKASSDSSATLVGIVVQGSIYGGKTNNVTVYNNSIKIKNDLYAYAITIHERVTNSTVSNNNISTMNDESYYVNGIDISDYVNNTNISNNYINLTAVNLTYGINLMGFSGAYVNNTIMNNNRITVNSHFSRAIESYFTNETSISSDVIIARGDYTCGIAFGATENSLISDCTITTYGQDANMYKDADNIPLYNSGIHLTSAEYYRDPGNIYNSTNNEINMNNIYSYGNASINLNGSYNNITNCNLTLNTGNSLLYGDSSVYIEGENNILLNNSGYSKSVLVEQDDDDLSKVHVITQDNYQDYFLVNETGEESPGLSDLVLDGDVLDIQGEVQIAYMITIDKAVNITSSTNDGVITTNTDDDTRTGGNLRRITITEAGSNTNVTNITVYNVEFFTLGAKNITIDHLNLTNIGKEIGSSTGVFSLRSGVDGDSYNITVTNSYFHTENNNGHSNVVGAGVDDFYFINNTVEGVGTVGNLFYLTTYDGGTASGNIYVINNTFTGPEVPLDICWAMVFTGSNVYVANNVVNYTGISVNSQYGGASCTNFTFINNTFPTDVNIMNATLINNTAGNIYMMGEGQTISGNIVGSIIIEEGSDNIIVNNTITSNTQSNLSTSNSIIANNTYTSSDPSLNITGSNNIISESTDNLTILIIGSNNTITDTSINNIFNLEINGSNNNVINLIVSNKANINATGSSNILENISIENDATINLVGSENNLNNVTAAGNSGVKINGDNNTVTNSSFIKTTSYLANPETSQYVIIIDGTNNTVTGNYLVACDLYNRIVNNGDDAVSNAENNIVHDNNGNGTLPDVTEKTYVVYEISSFEELKEVLDNVKTNETLTSDEIVVINFKDGDYTATESLTWDNATGTIDSIIFNGTDQVITAQDLSLFITVGEGYNLTINNLTLKDFNSGNETIINNGVLLLSNSVFDNIKKIVSSETSFISIQENIFKNININEDFIVINSATEIVNNTFQDITMSSANSNFINLIGDYAIIGNNIFNNTSVQQSSSYLIKYSNNYGELVFENNTVTNFSSGNVLGISATNEGYIRNNTFTTITVATAVISLDHGKIVYIYNNTFSDLNTTLMNTIVNLPWNVISSTNNTDTIIYNNTFKDFNGRLYLNGESSIINNIFINATRNNFITLNTESYEVANNTYINCSLAISISTINDTTITTEDYTTTVTITADSKYGAKIDGQVTIFIDGNEYKTFDVINGEANITIENNALNLLDNQIEVLFIASNGSYNNTNTTFTITLAENMAIRIPEGTIYSGDTISIPVQVAVNGSLAKDGYVILKVNGKTVKDENGNPIEVQVDENGNAVFNYTIPDTTSDEYNITVVYAGSEGVVRSSTTLTRSLKTATIVVDQITAKPGQTVTLTAHITDQKGNAVTTGKLIFKLNGKTLKDSEGNTLYATIVNGVATLNYTIPDNFSAKDYILTAVYQGTGFERSEANNTLTLTKSTPTILPDSSVFGSDNKITITQGTESIQIKATINDPETNAPIDSTTVVTIKINDKTVTQQYVSNGQIDITVYTSSFKNPEYNITVVVGENSQYERTSFNGTLEIVSPNGLATSSSYNGTLLVKED